MTEARRRKARGQALVWLMLAAAPSFAATAFVTRVYHRIIKYSQL
jgi:hypothetical protein